jgi:hypothetical protein
VAEHSSVVAGLHRIRDARDMSADTALDPGSPAVPLADPATLPPVDPYRRPWPGREVTSGGVTLHVRETPGPDGTSAIYVHGLGGSAMNWTDLAGLLGSTGWGLWVAALGVTVLLRPARTRNSSAATETNGADGVAAPRHTLRRHTPRTAARPSRVEELRPRPHRGASR